MAPAWKEIAKAIEERLDSDLVPAAYATLSVPTAQIRRELERVGHVGDRPTPADRDRAADALVAAAARTATALGAMGGLGGAAALAPEILGQLIGSLRLAQRLAVVYGFDPHTEAGGQLLWRAMAAAHGVEMPAAGRMDVRLGEWKQVLGKQPTEPSFAATWMLQQILRRTTRTIARRTSRWIPGVGVGVSALAARKRMAGQGARMKAVYRRAFEGDSGPPRDIEEAIVV